MRCTSASWCLEVIYALSDSASRVTQQSHLMGVWIFDQQIQTAIMSTVTSNDGYSRIRVLYQSLRSLMHCTPGVTAGLRHEPLDRSVTWASRLLHHHTKRPARDCWLQPRLVMRRRWQQCAVRCTATLCCCCMQTIRAAMWCITLHSMAGWRC